MKLRRLGLKNFRSYAEKEVDLGEGVTVVVGPNAAGKTNLLEAVRLLSLGESFKADRIEEMIKFEEAVGRVEGELDKNDEELKLAVVVTRGELDGKRVAKRKFLVNEVGKRRADFVGLLPSVVFRPEDLELIVGSPSLRRRWLDGILLQAERDYQHSLMTYEKALRRRNRILESIREGGVSRYQLTFWDGLVVKHGQILTDWRERLIGYINEVFRRSDLFKKLRIEYDKSTINDRRLKQYQKEEVAAGHTLVGPHKDDLIIGDQERDLAVYGSRGEQRMAVLGMKMGELLYLEERLKEKPLLLLDDIFSELDKEHSREVRRVTKGRQVVVTTTDKKDVTGLSGVQLIEL